MALDETLAPLVQHLASAIAAELRDELRPGSLVLLEIPQLAEETGLSPDYLKEQCRRFERGNPDGLRCTRKEPGKRNSTLLVGRDWFSAWRESMAERNRHALPPELARKVARSRETRVSKKQATR
jgi:hypothetical protein